MTAPNQIPLRNFFKNSEATAYQISPDGKHLAYLAPYEQRMNVFVQDIATKNTRRITSITDRDLSGFHFLSNEVILYNKDFGGDENFHIFATKIDGSFDQDLTPFPGVKANMIDDLKEDSNHIIIGLNKRNPQIFDPYRLNIHTGELSILAENPGNIVAWMTDHDGKLRLAIATDGVNDSILYRNEEQDEFRIIQTTDFKSSLNPMFFTFDNQKLYAISNLERDKLAAVIFNPDTGKEEELIFEHPDVDLSGISYSRKRKVTTLISFTTDKPNYHFLDQERADIQTHLEAELPEKKIILTSHDKEENLFIIRTYNDRSLGKYFLFNKGTKELSFITDVGPWLKEEELSEMKPIQYQSRDGLTIHGYLTLPKNGPSKNLPVIVNPHGGPWARDTWTFNQEVQFLANRGYAVFQMNFRGSTGYGKAFWEASFKEWGLKMQDDITDGVQWLIESGIADPKRIGIYGGSYGGYATLAGITFTPDLYTCAIDYVGVSNLFTFMETIPPYWKPFLEKLYVMVGNPEDPKDKERLSATSPVFHVDKIKAPLFIAQGAKDPRVVQAESDQIVAALKERKVEVEYLLKENEGHGFRNEENRFEFYEKMEVFLKKHLG